MATLEIGAWSSRCLACNRSASPDETHHNSALGVNPGPGCGEKYTHVNLSYVGSLEFNESTRIRLAKKGFPALELIPDENFTCF